MTLTIARDMFAAEILKLRRNRALMAFALLLSVGVVTLFFGFTAVEHASNPNRYGPAGGLWEFSRGVSLVGLYFGSLTAALLGTEAATADLSSGVFRDLVSTGRSRLSLFAVKAPAALCVTLVFTAAAFALVTGLSFLFAGGRPTPGAGVILQSAGWIVLANAAIVGLAVGVGSVTGSRAVTLVGVIGWLTVATQLLLQATALGGVRDGLQAAALGHLAPVSAGIADLQMATGVAVAVVAGWLVIPLACGAWRTLARDA
jgi:ABC-type transport system involved in multi-copper enzyme maturation permease subunit